MTEEPQVTIEPAREPAIDPGPETEPTEKPSIFSRVKDFLLELLHVVVISLAIIVPVRYFLIQPFYVKGASMEPNFLDHEYLIIDEISYRFNEPQRGEIVVFRYPNDPRQYFIKRIIGLPGERIRVAGGTVWVYNERYPDGKALDESGYLEGVVTGGDRDVKVGANEYFLMGDNRPASLDSRAFGPVPRAFIVGKVWVRGWPPEKVQLYSEHPQALK